MECPKCQATMEPVRVDEIEVDRCVRCGGLWFDSQEHEAVRHREAAEQIDSGPAWMASMHNAQERTYCPRDGTLMARFAPSERPEIRVERCPTCDGSFFDAGEFTQLKEHELGDLVRRSRPVKRIS